MTNPQQPTPTITDKKSTSVVVSTESLNSDDIRNAGRNTNTKDIKKVFVLGDRWLSMSKDGTLLREWTTRERSKWGSFLDPM